MGIDRPDESAAPDVGRDVHPGGRDSSTGERDSPADEFRASADSEEARAAYCVEYRATVAAEYLAAWNEAVPQFRAAWEGLERQYPHPERSRPTVDNDGSWHGEGKLGLNSEQNAEVDRRCERIRETGKDVILPAMRQIESEESGRHLIGLKNFLKDSDRIKEKVSGELRPPSTLTAEQALSSVPDAVRFTLGYGEAGYADGVRTDTERLKAQGFELIRLKNTWASDQYKGINSQWREQESKVRFEVQFHTQVSFEAKQLSHKAYERLRGTTAQDAERGELETFQTAVCAMISIPPGATEIEDYPLEKRDG